MIYYPEFTYYTLELCVNVIFQNVKQMTFQLILFACSEYKVLDIMAIGRL